MPGGGLVSLVAYGAQNVILSGNPDMTYFYKLFKKYTHFSLETTSKLMDGPTDYPYDTTVQLRARVDRTGDLLSDMYFSFDIPAIYSKNRLTNFVTGPTTQTEFQWVRYIGAAAIQSVYITSGPNKVQEFTGEYLMSKAFIDYPKDKFEKWQQLVGDVPEMYDPANGIYGNPTATGGEYPTVYQDDTTPTTGQTNNPSSPATTVYVPLPFWFTEEGQALPLIGLQYYTIDVTINLTPSQQLYTVLDASGFRMSPNFRVFTPTKSIQKNIPDYVPTTDNSMQIRNFFTDINYTPPPLNTWACNPTLHTTYVFLPQKEQNVFASTPLMYLTRQVTLVSFPEIVNNQLLLLDIHNPITRIIMLSRRSDSVIYRNNASNFTNWWDWPNRPKIPTNVPSNSSFVEMKNATGLVVPAGQVDIIQALRILSNGNQLQELKPNSFYTNLTPWKYLDGGANRRLPVYSFELHSPTSQPAGSINSSAIRKFQIDLQVYPLPPDSTYIYSFNFYVENINFYIVESGMGDLKYAL
jgi:hypothetical protein